MRLLGRKKSKSASSIWRNKPTTIKQISRNPSPINHDHGFGLKTSGGSGATGSSLSRERLVHPHLGRSRTPISFMNNNSINNNIPHDPNVIDHYVHHGHITQAVRLFDRAGSGGGHSYDYDDESSDDNTRRRHNGNRSSSSSHRRKKKQSSYHRYGHGTTHHQGSNNGLLYKSTRTNHESKNLFSGSENSNGNVKLFDRRGGDSNSIGSTGANMRNVLIDDSRDDDNLEEEYFADNSSIPGHHSSSNNVRQTRSMPISSSPAVGESPSSISFMKGQQQQEKQPRLKKKSNRKKSSVERVDSKDVRETIQEVREENSDLFQLRRSQSLNHHHRQKEESRQRINKNGDKGRASSVNSAPAMLMIPTSKQRRAAAATTRLEVKQQKVINNKKQPAKLTSSKPPRPPQWYAAKQQQKQQQQVLPSLSTTSSISNNKGFSWNHSALLNGVHTSDDDIDDSKRDSKRRNEQQPQQQLSVNESFSVSSEIEKITGGGGKSFLQRRMKKAMIGHAKTSKSPVPDQSGRNSATIKDPKTMGKGGGGRLSSPSSSSAHSSSVKSHQQTKPSNAKSDNGSFSTSSQQRKQRQQPYELAHVSSTAAVVYSKNNDKPNQVGSDSSLGNDAEKEEVQNLFSYSSNLFGGGPAANNGIPNEGNNSRDSSPTEKITDRYIPQEIEWNKATKSENDGGTMISIASSLSSATAGRKELVEQIRQMMIIPLPS